MRIRLLFVTSWFFVLLLSSCKLPTNQQQGKVIAIKDGDSIVVLNDSNLRLEVRLAHIDCPERGQPFGKAARQFTSDFCFGKEVTLFQTDIDRYDRLVCEIEVAGESLNLALVQNGLAWHHIWYSDDRDFSRAEQKAKRAKKGLWTDPDPIPPWEWRKMKRAQ